MVTSHAFNVPEVHEIVDEFAEPKPNRQPRQPNSSPKIHLYSPPKFEYKSTVQQNSQLLRYYEQQKANAKNLAERLHNRKERIAPITPHPVTAALLQNTRRNLHLVPVTVTQPEHLLRVARKLTSSNYNSDELISPTARAIYVPPTKLQPEENLKALNNLIGKNPNIQLQGLKQLLQDPSQVKLIMPIEPSPFQAQGHTIPSSQHAVDINTAVAEAASEESKEVNGPSSITQLQAQLDETARLHAQQAIEAAQRQALVHVEEQHKAIAKAQEEARRIAMEKIRAHNEAVSQVYIRKKENTDSEEVAPTQTAENRIHTLPAVQQVITVVEQPQQYAQDYDGGSQQEIVYEQDNQEELQKLADESNKAYGGDEVSKSKCKRFVDEKLEMFRQQFCNHLRYSGKNIARNDALKDFVLEFNCLKIEKTKDSFSTKLREMYRENRKAFFSLCYFNVSNVQLINEFVFSNNLTDFNENLLRQKRETDDYNNNDGNEDDYYYYDDEIEDNSKNQTDGIDEDILPLASAQKLISRPKFNKQVKHPHYQEPDLKKYNIPLNKEIKTNKEPTNVIVINNSNDNHNHGANVKFHKATPSVVHRPAKHHYRKPKRTHVHKIIIHKKPSVKRILRVSKKVDTVLTKLGHTIRIR